MADGYGLGTVQVGSASISAWTRALGRERHRHRNKPRPRPHAIRHGPSATAKNERFDGFFHPAFGHPAAAGQPRHLPGFGRTSNPSDITSHCMRSEGQGLPSRNAAFRVTARSPQNVRSCDPYPVFFTSSWLGRCVHPFFERGGTIFQFVQSFERCGREIPDRWKRHQAGFDTDNLKYR